MQHLFGRGQGQRLLGPQDLDMTEPSRRDQGEQHEEKQRLVETHAPHLL